MNFKKIIIAVLLILTSTTVIGQTVITGYSNRAFSVKQNFGSHFGIELKTFTNMGEFANTPFEFAMFYGFKPGEYHRFSIGFGVNINPFEDGINSFSAPIALEIFPIKEMKRFSFVLEVSPEFDAVDDINLRQMWGIRYSFGKKISE